MMTSTSRAPVAGVDYVERAIPGRPGAVERTWINAPDIFRVYRPPKLEPSARRSATGTTDGPVELRDVYDGAGVTKQVWIAPEAIEQLRNAEQESHVQRAELGGFLFGHRLDRGRFVVQRAETAVVESGPTELQLDSAQLVAERFSWEVLGDWHVHSGGDLRPSPTDLKGWSGMRRLGETTLGMIVSRDERRSMIWKCWRVAGHNGRAIAERMEILTDDGAGWPLPPRSWGLDL